MEIRKITTSRTLYPLLAERTAENFYEDFENWVRHGVNNAAVEENAIRNEINNTIDDINATVVSISEKDTAISQMKAGIETTKKNVEEIKKNIDLKHQEVISKVIPIEATYNETTIDGKVRMSQILNLIGA